MQTLLDGDQIQQILAALADDIAADPTFHSPSPLPSSSNGHPAMALIGIRSRGELIAQRLAAELGKRVPGGGGAPLDVGALDITLYRDDLASRRAITIPQGTEMNFRLDDRPILLIDDVLETGRSVRAALDALVDFGRPRLIRLAVLIDRGRREYPISADFVGLHVPSIESDQKIIVKLKPADPEDGVYLS